MTPPPVSREAAQEAARHELAKSSYRHGEPWWRQPLARLLRWIAEHLHRAGEAAPGGGIGLALLAILLVALVALVVWRVGPLRRRARVGGGGGLDTDADVGADGHRRRAEGFAAEGRWAEAVRERLRATVRTLEDRTVLDRRPGRTASEVAAEAGAVLPELAADLRAATGAFDAIWYGGRAATADAYALVTRVDTRVATARPALVAP